MKTINIKGKEYVPVSERVKEFRERFGGDAAIVTELVKLTEDECVFKASIIGNGITLATGHAWEARSASNINRTSYVENCETSAVGRALAFFGIGIDASIASADEVTNAVEIQSATTKKVDKSKIAALRMRADQVGTDVSLIASYFDLADISEMNAGQWAEAMSILAKKEARNG